MSIYPSLIFFKSIFSRENWRGGGESLLKNVQWMITPTNHVIAQAGFTLREALGTMGIFEHLPEKMLVRPKKVLPSEREPTRCHCAIW